MTRLEVFMADPALRNDLRNALNLFAEICASSSDSKGFHDDERDLAKHLESDDVSDETRRWVDSAVLQAELARQMSEIGEAVEAVRKPGPDSHLPAFPAFLVEEADVVIRIGDTCGKRGLKLGDAIIAKMVYNTTRPQKHGKGS